MKKQAYRVDVHFKEKLRERELQIGKKNVRVSEKYDARAKALPPLEEGERVRVQDPTSKLWDRTGVVSEPRGNRQYAVRLDGSGRVTRRNRRHLRLAGPPTAPESWEGARLTPTPPIVSTGQSNEPPICSRPQRNKRRPAYLVDYEEGDEP